MDLFDEGHDSRGNCLKRPRLDHTNGANGDHNLMSTMSSPGTATGPGINGALSKKNPSRARSDSAPLGYGHGHGHLGGSMGGQWGSSLGVHGVGGNGRPRSGSGMGPRIPNIGNMSRNNVSTPLLSISTIPQ